MICGTRLLVIKRIKGVKMANDNKWEHFAIDTMKSEDAVPFAKELDRKEDEIKDLKEQIKKLVDKLDKIRNMVG